MTASQVTTLLDELSTEFGTGTYETNTWLEAKEISTIVLANNESIYPDETMQIKFDPTNDLFLLRTGYYEEDGVTFVPKRVTTQIDYKLILGIILYRPARKKSPYKVSNPV